MAKVDKWLKPKALKQITEWARDEKLNISDIASLMGVSSSTFRSWRNDYKEIHDAFEEGRKVVDEKVENSFFKMCTGFKEKVIRVHKIKRKEYGDNGKVIAEYEELVEKEEEQYIPPSVVAQKFYLCNRMNDKYRIESGVQSDENGDENQTGVVMLPEIIEHSEEVIEAEVVQEQESVV